MSLFKRLFGKKQEESQTIVTNEKQKDELSVWRELPGYLPVDKDEYELVSVIATAIAAGDQPDSQFIVKRIVKRNPEVQIVSAIATAIAAGDQPNSHYRVTSIKEKNN